LVFDVYSIRGKILARFIRRGKGRKRGGIVKNILHNEHLHEVFEGGRMWYHSSINSVNHLIMQPHIGLAEKTLESVNSILATVLADASVLYMKTRKFHWNVSGKLYGAASAV
jgi:hypothetical protein